MTRRRDISPSFRWNSADAQVARRLVDKEGSPEAFIYFMEAAPSLTDYAYWYFLGTLWVNYSGWTELQDWARMFSSTRPGKNKGLMKPYELAKFKRLPGMVTAYRAHREDEKLWLSYTLRKERAAMFAIQRGVPDFIEYRVPRAAVVALFLRRGEAEIIVLDHRGVQPKERLVLEQATISPTSQRPMNSGPADGAEN